MKLESFGRLPRYALVLAGGVVEGQRPRTALFELFGIRPDGDYQGRRVGAKSRRRIKSGDVIALWRGMPADQQLRAARAKLNVVPIVEGHATEAARASIQENTRARMETQ